MKTIYGKNIECLNKALELCKDNGCEEAVPYIIQRIQWMRDNNYEQ